MRIGPWGNAPLLTLFADVHCADLLRFLPAVGDLCDRLGPNVGLEVVTVGWYDDVPAGDVFGDPDGVERDHGVHLASPFRRIVAEGDLRLRSAGAAAGVIALLAAAEDEPLTVLDAVSRAFFAEGADLSDPATAGRLATGLGLDGPAVELFASSPKAMDMALEDAALADELGVSRGATLLYSHQDRLVTLPGPGMRGRDLHRAVIRAGRVGAPTVAATARG